MYNVHICNCKSNAAVRRPQCAFALIFQFCLLVICFATFKVFRLHKVCCIVHHLYQNKRSNLSIPRSKCFSASLTTRYAQLIFNSVLTSDLFCNLQDHPKVCRSPACCISSVLQKSFSASLILQLICFARSLFSIQGPSSSRPV